MARSSVRSRSIRETERVIVRSNYYWPDQQLNAWILVMLATGGTLIGIFAVFVIDQQQLGFGIPWILPYGITVGSLTVLFIIAMLILIYQRRLLPGVVMIGAFVLTALYITGIVETALQLFGPASDISSHCQTYVFHNQFHGANLNTLAWLQQNSTCQSWLAVFAFWIIGAVFLTWLVILGSNVARGVIQPPPEI
ncbi:hypothetical protein BDY17DRAFT_176031 [Neohortaea acidophila]|uniref:Arginase-like protein n=1 Tax=Neohortaea acidophila TaxID=245834 RepID=A0A6A6PPJ5_9PEZI|nr:uncharacterized protein BDY17DRAFT_176031 [Neohortaea acidophila]KAF2482030.1 hypothetical protein BDY17DRAFT_176031 [Neohortaea acidophila]